MAAPITSGDTALRSGRLIIAEAFHFEQKPIKNRLAISIPIFAIVALLLWFNMANQKGFDNIWGYFGWANQTLAVFSLWAVTVYFTKHKQGLYYLITLIPACFMTAVSITYLFSVKVPLIPAEDIALTGLGIFAVSAGLYYFWKNRKHHI